MTRRIIKAELFVFLWMFFLFPWNSHAEKVLVFLDNSGTLKPVSTSYRMDIKNIMDVRGQHVYFFAPVGIADKNARRLVDSRLDKAVRDAHVDEIFNFRDIHTKIDPSFKLIENTEAFRIADKIIIISDMESDYQISEKRWYFDQNDLMDVRGYLRRMKSWVEKHNKKILIVLHGWEKSLDRYLRDHSQLKSNDETFDTFDQEMDLALQTAKLYGMVRESWRNQILTAKGLYRFKTFHPKAVEIHNMAAGKGIQSIEAFIHRLCGCLPHDDPEGYVCVREFRDTFQIRIDFDRRLGLNAYHKEKFLKDMENIVLFAGPKRTVYLKDRVAFMAFREKTAHDSSVDYHFQISAGSGTPYYYPVISASVRQGTGQIEEKPAFSDERKKTSLLDMLNWVESELTENLLKNYIATDFPPGTKSMHLFLTMSDQQVPVPAGYRIYAETRQPGAPDPLMSHIHQILDREVHEGKNYGAMTLAIPNINQDAAIFLKLPGDRESDAITGLPISRVTRQDMKTRRNIFINIASEKMRPYEMTFQNDNGPLSWRVYLKELGEKYLIDEKQISDPTKPYQVNLLPGLYQIEMIPEKEIKAEIIPNLKVMPDTGASAQERIMRDSVSFEPDPLKDPSAWAGFFQNGYGDEPTFEEVVMAQRSAYFLNALLGYTSDQLANNTPDPTRLDVIKRQWENIYKIYFSSAKDESNKRLLRRAMKEINLSNTTDAQDPDSFALLKYMFQMFIYKSSNYLKGSGEVAMSRRNTYNNWINDMEKDKFIKSALADRIRVRMDGTSMGQ